MTKESNDNHEGKSVTFYPSFQALAAAASDACDDTSAVELRSALDYPAEPVEWLWPEKIPLGKVTLLIGDPGLGKSLIAIDAAARVARGAPFPAEAKSMEQGARSKTPSDSVPPVEDSPRRAPGSVLILSAEDQIADTIRPRLDAHGADPARVFFAPQLTDLRRDLAKLTATLDKLPDCRLIVVDPVNAYVGPSDSHFHTIVRKVLAPLAELAAKRRIAILAVTHLRKNSGAAIARAAGSMGFVAAARSVWTVCRDQSSPGRNLPLPVKNNLGPLGAGLAYSIATHRENGAAVIHWHAAPVTISAEDALTPTPKARGPEAEERRHAGAWLQQILHEGPREAWRIIDEGKHRGFSERTLRRALREINGDTRKDAFYGGWTWTLQTSTPEGRPASVPSPPIDAWSKVEPPDEKQPGPLGETWPLRENKAKNAARNPQSDSTPPDFSPPIAGPSPALAESIAFLKQLDAERKPPDPNDSADPNSPTGHPLLDQILTDFRKSPTTNDQRLSSARKKSARSHSRFLREPTPGTSLAQRTTHDPERCIAATFPPM